MDGLSSICAGLGELEEDENGNRIGYEKGEYCSDNLKDLLRFLRRDEPEKRDVFKQVCKWNIVGKDLIPIIEYCQEDRNLMLNAVKILVFLTMPVEPTSTDIPQQIEYLWGLKSSIIFSDTVPVVVSLLESPLENLENESFTEDDWKLVQLVLTLFRNILAIQDISTQQKAVGSASQFLSLRDKFLELLFKENVMDIIVALSQHTGGSHGYLCQDNLLLLEIFYYIFKDQEPESIAKIHCKASKEEEDDENSLKSLHSLMEEQEKRKLTRLRNLSCYSKFTGTYTRVTLDGSKALFKGNPCSVSGDVLRKAQKSCRGQSKRTIWDYGQLPSTKHQILESLHEFISQFLVGGYNVLMQSIREDIDKEHQEIQSSDVVVFFHVARFVTSFQYHRSFTSKSSNVADKEVEVTAHDAGTLFDGRVCGPVSETLNESMFLMVISKWRYSFEGLKQTNDYKLLSAAGSLVKTMMRMLDLVLKESPEDSNEPRTARSLLYKLFYDQTEEGMTHFILTVIKSFDTHKQSKSDLSNLVETMHVILRLMENLQARGSIRVSKKARTKKTKKTMTKKETDCEPSIDDAAARNEVGTSICEPSDNVNMLEKETVTTPDFTERPDESVRDSDKVDEPASKPANWERTKLETEDRVADDENNDLYLGGDDSSDDEQPVLTNEVDFKVSSLVSALANNTIIWKLCWLLKFYRSNPISTNHFILSILQRLCDDLELSPILYQLSILTIFYEILEEQKSKPCKEYENIVTFLTSFIRRMLRKMKNYPLLSVEVLFWKTRKECHYISCGSMLKELNKMKNEIGEGRSGTTDDGNRLDEGKKWVRRNIADALGDDDFEEMHHEFQEEDDASEELMIRQSSGEGKDSIDSILKKGIHVSKISDREEHSGEEELDRKREGGDPVLDDELQGKLYDLYEKFKDNSDCCQLIAGELDQTGNISTLQISKTLKQLGFKVPAKREKQNSDAINQLKSCGRNLPRNTMQPNLSIMKKSSSLRKPIHSRKRVQAFSADQEQKIKELFEQFKAHRRCSYMIANELDDTGNISAAQVSRKLKQLGLFPHKTKTKFHFRNGDSNDMPAESAGESGDETLLSLRNRSKHNPNGSERQNQKIARKSSEGVMDDDELLSSLLVKKKKMSPESDEEEFTTDSTKKNAVENNFQFSDIQVSERDEVDAANINTTNVNCSSDSESETMRLDSSRNASEIKSFDNPNTSQDPLFDDQLVDELVDFDENTDSVCAPEDNVVRRRARMVIDFEDDD